MPLWMWKSDDMIGNVIFTAWTREGHGQSVAVEFRDVWRLDEVGTVGWIKSENLFMKTLA